MKTIELPPFAPMLIESTRAIGYSLETAIADVIDNSIAAGANLVEVMFSPFDDPYLSILDNGHGMEPHELTSAMQYGSQSPVERRRESDLGRFGLGMKTASLSQCRVLTVVSKAYGTVSARRWDIDHIRRTGQWSLLVLEHDNLLALPNYDRLLSLESGTLVLWQKHDLLLAGETNPQESMGLKMDRVTEHLGLVFHRYLESTAKKDQLKITINHVEVKPSDPFLSKKSSRAIDDEIIRVEGAEIRVRPYILPHQTRLTKQELQSLGGKDGVRKNQGFYIYRNKRLIIWGTWFNMMPKGEMSKLSRIRVDIPNSLDHLWSLDIKKSTAVPPDVVKKNLRSLIETMAKTSKRTYTYRGRVETSSDNSSIWQRVKSVSDGYYYQLNREHSLVKYLLESNPYSKPELETLFTRIERNIPINQLYVDLSSDEKVDNALENSAEEVDNSLRYLLKGVTDSSHMKRVLSTLSYVEPFNNYPEIIGRYLEGINQ